MLSFTVNNREYTVHAVDPLETVLSYLRKNGITDLKQMCEEGGCGACTLIELRNNDGEKTMRSMAACLIPLAQANNRVFVTPGTVASTKSGKEICQTFAENFASQCGYCTPAIVTDISSCTNDHQRQVALDGHICRCTGYRPIKTAIKKAPFMDIEELGNMCASCPRRSVNQTNNSEQIPVTNGHVWHRPKWITEVLELMRLPDSRIVAGDTAKLCEMNYGPMPDSYQNMIDLGQVEELHIQKTEGNTITIGGAVNIQTFTEMVRALNTGISAKIVKALEFVGSVQIREQGTITGALYLQRQLSFFPSDLAVILGCLGAKFDVYGRTGHQSMSLDEFLNSTDENDLLVEIEVTIPTTGVLSIGKITNRPTMCGGIITYAFYTDTRLLVGKYYYNIGKGVTHINPPEEFSKEGFSQSLDEVKELLIKCQFYRHYHEVAGTSIEQLDYTQKEYFLDDSNQLDRARNVPVQHAFHLAAGTASFLSDIPPTRNQLHIAFVKATRLENIDSISFADCKADKDFVRGITAADITSSGLINSIHQQGTTEAEMELIEEILCSKSVLYIHQPVAIVVASSRSAAYRLRRRVNITYSNWSHPQKSKPCSSLKEAIEKKDFFKNPYLGFFDQKEKGNVDKAFERDDVLILEGEFDQPGQYHTYMETHYARVTMNDQNVDVDCASQGIDFVQRAVANILGLPHASVSVKCRRIGGAFGGKISRGAWVASAATVAAKMTDSTCSMHLNMQDCIQVLGGRSVYRTKYKAAFEKTGKCVAVDMQVWSDSGAGMNDNLCSSSYFAGHVESSYHIRNFRYDMKLVRTAQPVITWCRAPGQVQALLCMERVIDHACRKFHFDQVEMRKLNFSRIGNLSFDGKETADERCLITFNQLLEKSKYYDLLDEIRHFNGENEWKKKGISIQSMKFPHGIWFHFSSVMVSVQRHDGSVQATVGGIDMGQGQHTRCAQVIANNLGCSLSRVVIKPTSTDVNVNTTPTGGTVTSHTMMLLLDKATDSLKKRMIAEANRQGKSGATWDELVEASGTIDLQERAQGNFYGPGSKYDIAGASLAVVELDCLTGLHLVERLEIVYDAGQMINVGTELGQLEGGVMMGISWLKSEDVTYTEKTGVEQHGTWDYKMAMHKDLPKTFKIYLNHEAPEFEGGDLTDKPMNYPMSSKQAGESAMCLSFSPTSALQNAIEAFTRETTEYVPLPAIPSNVFPILGITPEKLCFK